MDIATISSVPLKEVEGHKLGHTLLDGTAWKIYNRIVRVEGISSSGYLVVRDDRGMLFNVSTDKISSTAKLVEYPTTAG